MTNEELIAEARKTAYATEADAYMVAMLTEALEAEHDRAERYEAALMKFGSHLTACTLRFSGTRCDCGLWALAEPGSEVSLPTADCACGVGNFEVAYHRRDCSWAIETPRGVGGFREPEPGSEGE